MEATYQEQLYKIQVYKDMLKQHLIKLEQYPTASMVQSLVDKVDLRYSILSHTTIKSDTDFDVEQFNLELFSLYQDLIILYKTIMIYETKMFVNIESEINGYLTSLEDIADKCEKLTNSFTESTGLGETIYYKDCDFKVELENNTAEITIDEYISAEACSLLSCFINGSGFNNDNVHFVFYKDNEQYAIVKPHDVDGTSVKAGGTKSAKYYAANIDSNTVTTTFKVSESIIPEVNSDYEYEAYAGKNKIIVGGRPTEKYDNTAITCDKQTSVKFYIKNGTYVNFDFSKEPVKKNFTAYENKIVSFMTEVVFTVPPNTTFEFETDGELFAEKVNINITNDSLYLTKTTAVDDIVIIEIMPGEEQWFDRIKIFIDDIQYSNFKLNYIAIKQLNNLK